MGEPPEVQTVKVRGEEPPQETGACPGPWRLARLLLLHPPDPTRVASALLLPVLCHQCFGLSWNSMRTHLAASHPGSKSPAMARSPHSRPNLPLERAAVSAGAPAAAWADGSEVPRDRSQVTLLMPEGQHLGVQSSSQTSESTEQQRRGWGGWSPQVSEWSLGRGVGGRASPSPARLTGGHSVTFCSDPSTPKIQRSH